MILVTKNDFNVDEELKRLKGRDVGCVVNFVGVVRKVSDGKTIESMEIDVYPEMAEKQLEAIKNESITKFGVIDVSIVHRFGKLGVGDNIVLVAVSSGHRKEAFEACRYVIDELKKRVPIWKKEYTSIGSKWVEVDRSD